MLVRPNQSLKVTGEPWASTRGAEEHALVVAKAPQAGVYSCAAKRE